MYDLVIRNAMIHDGAGGPGRPGDLAVGNGRIVEIGGGLGAGREQIDADGLVLAPGLIDVHTHYDAQITWDPYVDPSPRHGVTTVVMGNCGFTIAPCRPEHRDLTMRNLTHVEGMSLDALRAGVRWDFESFPDYLAMLERQGVGPNVAAFIGHSSVRTYVMGADASRRAARADEIAAMRALVLEGVRAGAVGFSTTTFEGHNGEGGVPMPSQLAAADELESLVKTLGEVGRGVFMLTKGSATRMADLESLAAASGRPVIVAALLHNPARPDSSFNDLATIAAARARRHDMIGQISCCPLTMEFTLKSPYPMESHAPWRPAMAAHDQAALTVIYADPAFRAAMKRSLAAPAGVTNFSGDWARVRVAEVADRAHGDYEGRTIAELAAAENKDPFDWFLDLGIAENLETLFAAELLNIDEAAVGRMLRDPNALITLSDAGAHLTFLCDAGYGLYLLGHWVRERGVLSLAQAIHALTARQAEAYRIMDRGRLVAGAFADLILFDPDTVGRTANKRVFDLPAGASRLTSAPIGLHGVWVNGTRIADSSGALRPARPPGQVIRSFAA